MKHLYSLMCWIFTFAATRVLQRAAELDGKGPWWWLEREKKGPERVREVMALQPCHYGLRTLMVFSSCDPPPQAPLTYEADLGPHPAALTPPTAKCFRGEGREDETIKLQQRETVLYLIAGTLKAPYSTLNHSIQILVIVWKIKDKRESHSLAF